MPEGDYFELQPVITATTDQGSNMFAAHVILAYHEGIRLVWFPGCCHQESNTDTGMMTASGFKHLGEKAIWLAKFNHGPYKGGRWLGMQKMAAEAFVAAVRARDPVSVGLLESQMASICADRGWAGPDTQHSWEKASLYLALPSVSFLMIQGMFSSSWAEGY